MAKSPMTLELLLFFLPLILSPLLVTAEDFSKSCAGDLIILFSLVFLLLAAFVGYYIRRYGNGCLGAALDLRQEQAIAKAARGLGAAAMESLPSIRFSEIKRCKIGQGELECTVCLSQFKDQEILSLLPDCCHVFHSDCIKPWLVSHVTCPVCREEVSFANKCMVQSVLSDHHLTVETDGSSSMSNSLNNEGLTRGGERLRRSHSTGELVVGVVEDNSRSRLRSITLRTEISSKSQYRENIMNKSKGWNCFSSSSKLDRLVDYYSNSSPSSLQTICIT